MGSPVSSVADTGWADFAAVAVKPARVGAFDLAAGAAASEARFTAGALGVLGDTMLEERGLLSAEPEMDAKRSYKTGRSLERKRWHVET